MFKCNTCGDRFYSQVDCAAHIEAEHPDANPQGCTIVHYRCPRCGNIFGHWMDCRNHAMREHGMQKVVCEEQPV
jgi:uncharacterized C2H2 Zn-finger protein